MALVTGAAIGAVAMSGIALGTACSAQVLAAFTQTKMEAIAAQASQRAAFSPPEAYQQQQQQACPQAPPRRPMTAESSFVRKISGEPDNETIRSMAWEGFSMEEAKAHADAEHSRAAARTPSEVLAELQRGNARFWTGSATRPEASAFERRALISKQFPCVAILGCSDSRVPTEIIFDQGLGDIFVVRVAGNALDVGTTASLQYAVNHLKVKVLVVLGHELCGAVKAAQLPMQQLSKEPTELSLALQAIKTGLDESRLAHFRDTRALDREAVTTNVRQQVERLAGDEVFMKKVRQGELLIVGGFYEISSGIVDFFHEVSAEDGNAPSPKKGVSSRFLPGKA
mmetsp:Transcript_88591/g.255543  ORF Transcript_88591/g.255543 Transcript_88591/m.255543 type:complete len:341 (+) Transcript_88591:76-1098(+)